MAEDSVSMYTDLAEKVWKRMVGLVGIHTVMVLAQRAVWSVRQNYEEGSKIRFDENGLCFEELRDGVPPARSRAVMEEFFGALVGMAVDVASLYDFLKERLGTLLSLIRHGVVVTDSAGRVGMSNRAAHEILSTRGITLTPGSSVQECGLPRPISTALLGAAGNGRRHFKQQSVLGTGDDALYLKWDVAPIHRDDGASMGAILMFEDITEVLHLRTRMREWERLATAGEVAASLAHEIRNPLAAAKAVTGLISTTSTGPKKGELLARLERELDRMNRILTDFLRLAKPSDENYAAPVDLPRVVDEVAFLLSEEASLNNVECRTHQLPPEGLLVTADSDSLKQVFLNIGKNAIEALVDGGRVDISLGCDEKRACVIFRDNGPGIPPENLPNIFRPFFTTKLSGTGLGLSISQDIVRRMRGDLSVKSDIGKGTTVYVFLPLYKGDEESPRERVLSAGG